LQRHVLLGRTPKRVHVRLGKPRPSPEMLRPRADIPQMATTERGRASAEQNLHRNMTGLPATPR
jgi:hypothetical protein